MAARTYCPGGTAAWAQFWFTPDRTASLLTSLQGLSLVMTNVLNVASSQNSTATVHSRRVGSATVLALARGVQARAKTESSRGKQRLDISRGSGIRVVRCMLQQGALH